MPDHKAEHLPPLPRPPHGAMTRADARNAVLTTKRLSLIWNRHRVAELDEALAILADPELGALGITVFDLTGEQIRAGVPLGNGVVARRDTPEAA